MHKLSLFFFACYLVVISSKLQAQNFINQTMISENITIQDIHHALKNRKINCEKLIEIYIDRIKKYNLSLTHSAPYNAITEINQDALEQAKRLDNKLAKLPVYSLFCIPIILKDNINAYDLTTTAGSLSLLGSHPTQDAFLVKQLRDAGAIILAQGTMDELASGLYGINGRNGRTGNAYNPSQNPGGSSSGPAVAVSVNMSMLGIGTDNSGSIRVPAAFNGIVGLRPTMGLISQHGIFPRGNMDGIAGPIARNVTDLAYLLDVIAVRDPHDPKTYALVRPKTYTAFLNRNGLFNKRIGIVSQVGQLNIEHQLTQNMQQVIINFIRDLQHKGAIVKKIKLDKYDSNRQFNQAGEVEDINAYLSTFPSTRKNYKDICESNRTLIFGSVNQCLKLIKQFPKKYSKNYNKAFQIIKKNKNYVEKIMSELKLDALLLPISTTGVATYENSKILTWQAPVASNAGLPAITINIGYQDNMPIGVELIGKSFSEGTLLELAYGYEQNFLSRSVPLLPSPSQELLELDIPTYNNLLTLIGYESYKILKNNNETNSLHQILTAEKMNSIVNNQLIKLKMNESRKIK